MERVSDLRIVLICVENDLENSMHVIVMSVFALKTSRACFGVSLISINRATNVI